jgi:hypothetical protein
MKTCKVCGESKPLDHFYVQEKDGRSYHHSYCKPCHKEARRQWHFTAAGQKAHRRQTLRQKYDVSLEEYANLLASQNGVCAICQEPEKAKNRAGSIRLLAVDHCHASGKIRGLLCFECNRGLGAFRDNPKLLSDAIDYLMTDR